MESLGSFPQEAWEQKPTIMNYCPRCGTKTEKGGCCINCGRDLIQPFDSPAITVQTPMLSLLKRPNGIAVLCVLWFFGGLINVFGGVG